MNWYISFISGLIQGLTEFLPVSSSGHLVLLHHFFKMPSAQLEFDIFLHIGTLGAVVFVFYKDIIEMLTVEKRNMVLLIVATIPAAITAILFDEKIEQAFSHVRFVGFALLLTAFFLFVASLAEKSLKKREKVSFFDAVLIGLSQALAILPGVSRSGLTISTALFRGISKKQAVKFSFLMAVFAIGGAYFLKVKNCNFANIGISPLNIIVGVMTAFLVGVLAIKLVFKALLADKWHFFAIYCAVLGVSVLTFLR